MSAHNQPTALQSPVEVEEHHRQSPARIKARDHGEKALRTPLVFAQQPNEIERGGSICHHLFQGLTCRDLLDHYRGEDQDFFQWSDAQTRSKANHVARQIHVNDNSTAIEPIAKLTCPSAAKMVYAVARAVGRA
jgi:hypothetical protein